MRHGETFHFKVFDLPTASIFVSINTEGWGNIAYAIGEETPEIDPERPFQSAQVNLAEPDTYTFVAWPQTGNVFVKWTKDGEDFSSPQAHSPLHAAQKGRCPDPVLKSRTRPMRQ